MGAEVSSLTREDRLAASLRRGDRINFLNLPLKLDLI